MKTERHRPPTYDRDVRGQAFLKGHGTENDFVLLPDLDDRLDLTAAQIVAICDRRAGLGADGVLRIARDNTGSAPWFMDYRNADGSVVEMCGNGIRVFARYLVDAGSVGQPRDERAVGATRTVTRLVPLARPAGAGLAGTDDGDLRASAHGARAYRR